MRYSYKNSNSNAIQLLTAPQLQIGAGTDKEDNLARSDYPMGLHTADHEDLGALDLTQGLELVEWPSQRLKTDSWNF